MKVSEGSSIATRPSGSSASSVTRPDRYRLTGPSVFLDRRTHAYRPDLVDLALSGQVFGSHYASPTASSIGDTSAMVRAAPDITAPAISQLLCGERFWVLDQTAGWVWGRCDHDRYVGYVQAEALSGEMDATHCVNVPLALRFSDPNIKSPALGTLPLGARIRGRSDGQFVATADGFLHRRHLIALDHVEPDPVAVAERMVGQPYLWGGRGGGGIDCSGLVQAAFGLAGVALPRDSDQQRATAGLEQPCDAPLARGDLIFFPGHVGIMVDGNRMIHANAHWMQVTIEPLADVVARLRPAHAEPILAVRRMAA